MYFFVQDFEKLANFVSEYYNTSLEKQDMSVKGWNWGMSRFVGKWQTFIQAIWASKASLSKLILEKY